MSEHRIKIVYNRLPEAKKQLERLKKKAKKYGQDFDYRFENKRIDYIDSAISFRKFKTTVIDLVVSGVKPFKIGNYEFIAKVEVTPNGNIVTALENVEVPDFARNTDDHCDHCHINRKRNEVFIVRNLDTKKYLQVGKTCLRDFLGIDNPASVVNAFRFEKEIRDSEELFRTFGYNQYSVEDIFAASAYIIKKDGWISSSKAKMSNDPNIISTANIVASTFFSDKAALMSWGKLSDKDYEIADKVVKWILNQEPKNDYIHNLQVMVKNGYFDVKKLPFLVSAVGSYYTHINRERQEKRNPSEYVGKKGEKIKDILITVERKTDFSSRYGDGQVIKMIDENGNIFIWYTSSYPELETGSKYLIDATIKDHKKYKDVKQTIVTRVKFKAVS